MARKNYRTIIIEEEFAIIAELLAVKHKRSLSNQIEVAIEECKG